MGGYGKRIPIPDEDTDLFRFERAKPGDPKYVEFKWFRKSYTIRETRWRASHWRIPIYIFLFGVIFWWLPLTVGPLQYMWNHRQPLHPRERLGINDLLIDALAFPDGWMASPDGPRQFSRAYPANVRAQLFFYNDGRTAQQTIRHFPEPAEAEAEFERQTGIWFAQGIYSPDWHVPHELGDLEVDTDFVQIGCILETPEVCHFIAVFEPYVVHFSAPMGSSMTYAEFLVTTREVEERFFYYQSVEVTKASLLGVGGDETP